VPGVLLVLLAMPAGAQTVVGGDTIKLDGTTYRIWGIDASETKQACQDGWMAGKEQTAALLNLVKGRTVTCEAKMTATAGSVALCRPDGIDLRAAVVSAGTPGRSPATAATRSARRERRSAHVLACLTRLREALGLPRQERGRAAGN
jgi:endonuclease YncB( thermonuclease family)